MSSNGFTAVRGVFYAVLFTLLWAWIAVSVRRFDSRFDFDVPGLLRLAGVLLLVCGVVLAAACVAVFAARGHGTPAPFDAPREFVASGPYRYVRNPMYIGGALVIAGAGLILGSVSIVLLSVVFIGVAHIFVLAYEERNLKERFGSSYIDYQARVRRWIPRRPSA